MSLASQEGMLSASQRGVTSISQAHVTRFAGENDEQYAAGDDARFTQRRTDQEEPDQEDDSNQHPLIGENGTTGGAGVPKPDVSAAKRPPYSPYIALVALDLSRELGDMNGASNATQALRLWHASGLNEQAFVEVLQTARRAVRGAQAHGVANKGAYWMAVVRERLGLTQSERE